MKNRLKLLPFETQNRFYNSINACINWIVSVAEVCICFPKMHAFDFQVKMRNIHTQHTLQFILMKAFEVVTCLCLYENELIKCKCKCNVNIGSVCVRTGESRCRNERSKLIYRRIKVMPLPNNVFHNHLQKAFCVFVCS